MQNEIDTGEYTSGELSSKIDFSGVLNQISGVSEESYGAHYEIVSRVAYLIGIRKWVFDNEHEPPKIEIYNRLQMDKRARIIRNLCRLRTALEINFKKICDAMQHEHRSLIGMPEYLPSNWMQNLSDDGVDICQNTKGTSPSPFLLMINNEIKNRINNCRDLFPEWIEWKYLADLFIMPDGSTDEGTKRAAAIYYENQTYYPYKQYINWIPRDYGNILQNDKKFITVLYDMNLDEFRDLSRVADVSDYTKSNIYSFIENSDKTVFIVDCENSDPYALCAAIRNLDKERLRKIEKIILYDDVHAASAWEMLESYIDVPVEYIMIERLKDNKSLADIKVATRTCQEFYTNGVDSFVLVSSDSDFWGLIEELPDTKFFVMIEHQKSSYVLKDALITSGIHFCYIDDFYEGDGNEIKQDAIRIEISRSLKAAINLNLNSLMNEVLERTRIDWTFDEKQQYIKRHLKNSLSLDIDEHGDVSIEYREKR